MGLKIRDKIAGVKFHAAWDVNSEWVEDFKITVYRKNDGNVGKTFNYNKNKIYVFDKAYVDLELWIKIQNSGAHFVTRLKNNGHRLKYIHDAVLNEESQGKTGVLYDGPWSPSEASLRRAEIKTKTLKYRHIIYRDPETKKTFDFITSQHDLPAEQIAEIYKKRWAVELLFRWLKGHLNLRRISFKNINAIKIQITIAVITQLLLRLKMLKEKFKGSSSEMLRRIRSFVISSFFENDSRSELGRDDSMNSTSSGGFNKYAESS